MTVKERDSAFIANTYARYPLVAESGNGARVTGENGQTYIDLGSGIAVDSFGVCDEEWVKAVTEQLHKIQHFSNLFYTEPQVQLAQMLCERTGMQKVFFGNSGAEANECAIKTARKYAFDKYGADRADIVTLQGSFHGRTLATLAAAGQDALHPDCFAPYPGGFLYAPANDFPALEALCGETVCAVMLELVQGEGGVLPLEPDYVKQVSKLCKEKDILLVIDEVQTGNGRTGTLYAYQQYPADPDIVTTAKGLGGGLPLGACMFGVKTAATLTAGTHGSTFGGNPVCCAGAVSILSRIDGKLLSEVREKGEFIESELSGAPGVKSVTGLGLMLGIETEKSAKNIAAACLVRGVVVLTAKDKVRLLPPLNIAWEELRQAIQILKGVIAE